MTETGAPPTGGEDAAAEAIEQAVLADSVAREEDERSSIGRAADHGEGARRGGPAIRDAVQELPAVSGQAEVIVSIHLDADGVAELTFAYRTTCTSDVSPLTLKLLMLEQGAKYILRGSTRVDVGGGERMGGERQPDAALKKVPDFRAHAEEVWGKIVGP